MLMIPVWLVIGLVAVAIGLGINWLIGGDQRWFFRLKRPGWLVFERLIPVVWTVIFIAGGWSAYVLWIAQPGRVWGLMVGYMLLEIVTLAYTPIMCRLRSLKVGTAIGATGFFVCAGLAALVWPLSNLAGWLLLPYLLWSPIGTFVTWQMMGLNPRDL
jgi:translocator protein